MTDIDLSLSARAIHADACLLIKGHIYAIDLVKSNSMIVAKCRDIPKCMAVGKDKDYAINEIRYVINLYLEKNHDSVIRTKADCIPAVDELIDIVLNTDRDNVRQIVVRKFNVSRKKTA